MKFLIVGSDGQLGKVLQDKLLSLSIPFYSFSRNDLNIENFDQINSLLSDIEFDLVINCAAYTEVDEAESNSQAAFWTENVSTEQIITNMLYRGISISIYYVSLADI